MKKILFFLLFLNCTLTYSEISVTNSVIPVHCFGDNTGQITTFAVGGTGTYTYILMSGGTILSNQSSNVFNNLFPGVYTVIVADSLAITGSAEAVVIQSTDLITSVDVIGNTASGNASGGTPPYFYSIDGLSFLANNTFLSIPPGNYMMYIKDTYGCMKVLNFTISALSTSDATFGNFDYYSDSNKLTFSNSIPVKEVNLYSILGEKKLSIKMNSTSAQIDLSGFSNGIYFVKFMTENQQKTIKIIKD